MKKKLIIKQDEDNEVPAEIMADSIVQISQALNKLMSGRLKRDAIIALIKDKSGLTKGTIEIVLNNLEALEHNWIKKK